MVLVRPADLLEPEYDRLREYTAPWFEQEEDILTYAMLPQVAEKFLTEKYDEGKPVEVSIPSDPNTTTYVVKVKALD